MTESKQSDEQIIKSAMDPVVETKEKPICNFGTRLLALLIDSIIIGIFGFVLGGIFSQYFIQIGGWARLIGFLIAILYFGLQNSVICHGQTVGKRITKIRVVDRNEASISITISICRSAILLLPYFLNGALIPPSITKSPFGVVIALLIFGGGISIIYLYIFNKRTRQSLHDIITKTFVVNVSSEGPVTVGPVARIHYVIVALFFVGTLAITTAMGLMIDQRSEYLGVLYDQVNKMENVSPARVSVGTASGPKGSNRYVAARVIYKKDPGDFEVASEQVAKMILATNPPISYYDDVIAVTIMYGYDIGIASSWRSYAKGLTPAEWKERFESRSMETD